MVRFVMRIIEHAVTVADSYSPPGSHSNGSIGMLFVVLVVIIILGLLAGFLARICGGRHFAGNLEYDFEGWVERTCASCIDGSMPSTGGGGHTVPKAASVGAAATKQTENKGGDSDALKSADGKGGEKKRGGNGADGGGENKGVGKKGKGEGGGKKGGENKERGTGAAEGGDKGDGRGETSGETKEGEGES